MLHVTFTYMLHVCLHRKEPWQTRLTHVSASHSLYCSHHIHSPARTCSVGNYWLLADLDTPSRWPWEDRPGPGSCGKRPYMNKRKSSSSKRRRAWWHVGKHLGVPSAAFEEEAPSEECSLGRLEKATVTKYCSEVLHSDHLLRLI